MDVQNISKVTCFGPDLDFYHRLIVLLGHKLSRALGTAIGTMLKKDDSTTGERA